MRLALLSNVTLEVLAGLLGNEHELWLPSGFGAWMETALDVPESLRAFDPDAVFVLLDSSHAAWPDEARQEQAASALERAFPRAAVFVPDLADLAEETGSFYDERMWQLASMPWSLRGLKAIAGEMSRLLESRTAAGRKVLAVDFDNTLWEGVVGEDGPAAIVPRVEDQRRIKALQARGILLVGLSRNNAEDVAEVWRHPRMVLKPEDFVAMRLNWRPKAENLADVARQLNLGTDSFVFLDDNPVERAEMRAVHPEVATPDYPIPIRRLARLYFPPRRVTAEDRAKTALYRAEARRAACRDAHAETDFAAYLKDLAIWHDVHLVREDELARVAQLSQKANQFNVCTNRYAIGDVARFARDGGHLLWTVRAGDRFGDQGLVAFVHAERQAPAEWELVDWVMSCRAMNRRLEFSIEAAVERALAGRGAARLFATWRRTPKNAPVQNLFEQFGFAVLSAEEGRKRYRLDLPRAQPDGVRAAEGDVRRNGTENRG
ncbi:MAG: HAD-IIIC family phosphatase [Kiritimatiellia bacterium]